MLRLRSISRLSALRRGARNYSNASIPLFINGKAVQGTAKPFDIISPWTMGIAGSAQNARVEQALEAAKAAGTGGLEWSKLTPQRRRELLLEAAKVIFQSDLCQRITTNLRIRYCPKIRKSMPKLCHTKWVLHCPWQSIF